jgi:hypothetical protein
MRKEDTLSPAQGKSSAFFYWAGIVLALVCMGLVVAKNTPLVWRLETAPLPVCWLAGVGSIVAFILSELCDRVGSGPSPAPGQAESTPAAELVKS